MTGMLVLAAILIGLAGAALLSQATLGVGVICLGCLVAILARLSQADAHERARVAAPPLVRPKLTAAVVGITVAAIAVVALLDRWPTLTPAAAPHSRETAYQACAAHAAKAAGTSADTVDTYSRGAVTPKDGGRYAVAATVAGTGGARAGFQCEVEWLTGTSYTLLDLQLQRP